SSVPSTGITSPSAHSSPVSATARTFPVTGLTCSSVSLSERTSWPLSASVAMAPFSAPTRGSQAAETLPSSLTWQPLKLAFPELLPAASRVALFSVSPEQVISNFLAATFEVSTNVDVALPVTATGKAAVISSLGERDHLEVLPDPLHHLPKCSPVRLRL